MDTPSKKLRIVFGINDFGVGGAERMTARLIGKLDPERFECVLITLLPNPAQNALHELPASVTVHSFSFTGLFDIRSWRALSRTLRELRPNIVVSSLFFANTIFRTLRPLLGYVSISREHNTYINKPYRQQLIDRLLAPQSHTIVGVSKTVADFTAHQEHISRARFTVIHNGIDMQASARALAALPSREAVREELGFGESDKILLTVARLTSQKNHELLLKGFARFREAHPEYVLAIVGEGDERSALEAQAASLGLSEVVRFFGHQQNPWKFYALADFFVSASVIEGMSNAYLEALAAGVPLVATLTAGTDELLKEGENGFAIHSSTPEAVAEALTRAAAADRQALSKQAKETAEEFSLERTVRAYEALFTSAAAGHH